MTIGEAIKKARITAGYKRQKDFADKLMIPPSHLCKLETDKTLPSHETMQHIAAVLGGEWMHEISGVKKLK